jgi:hypothetical protein
VVGPWAGHGRRERRTESWRPARKPRFVTSGAALEYASAVRQHGLRYHGLRAAIFLVGLAGFCWVSDLVHGGNFAGELPIILFLWVILSVATYLASRLQSVYVGATWITEKYQDLADSESKRILNTYELAEIRVDRFPGDDAMLMMVNRRKKSLRLPLGLLEANPRLWDYVYNGLMYSTARGARVDPVTRGALQLPDPGAAGEELGTSMSTW